MKIKMESGERIAVEVPNGASGCGAIALYDNSCRVIASIVFEDNAITSVVIARDGAWLELLPECK